MTDLFKDIVETPNGGYTKKREPLPERALVFVVDRGPGFEPQYRPVFVDGYGPGIESDIEAGLDRNGELGPTPFAPDAPGFWLWDGTPFWRMEYSEGICEGATPEYEKRGTWRRLTADEAVKLATGDTSLLVPPAEEDA